MLSNWIKFIFHYQTFLVLSITSYLVISLAFLTFFFLWKASISESWGNGINLCAHLRDIHYIYDVFHPVSLIYRYYPASLFMLFSTGREELASYTLIQADWIEPTFVNLYIFFFCPFCYFVLSGFERCLPCGLRLVVYDRMDRCWIRFDLFHFIFVCRHLLTPWTRKGGSS